jgi:hypothetical protein
VNIVSVVSQFAGLLRHGADRLEQLNAAVAPAKVSSASQPILDEYVATMPSPQNAVDALPGWNTAFPPEIPVVAGPACLYYDPRILWALDLFGSLEGRHVIELGPLEASHTYMLEQRQPASIDAVEANKLSFLRCLVVKELLGLRIARFHLGNFIPWLEVGDQHYDFLVASGVLYHMNDPVRLLELIAERCNAFYLWTHYASDEAMPIGDPRRLAFVGEPTTEMRHGVAVRTHLRSYWGAWKDKAFCGGMQDLHRWIEKQDILAVIQALGFGEVYVAHDDPTHQNGPSFSIFARR